MGDGSLILLPTPGHTPGSISLLIRSNIAPPILLIGDLAYSVTGLMKDRFPGTGDPAGLLESYEKVRGLQKKLPDLLIVPSHDDQAIVALNNALQQEGDDEHH